uniref:ATP synthase F0 subunit 8 n=1 Tax=Acrobeloides nanus TaxID=290746 RepID=A0A914D724_9BILA
MKFYECNKTKTNFANCDSSDTSNFSMPDYGLLDYFSIPLALIWSLLGIWVIAIFIRIVCVSGPTKGFKFQKNIQRAWVSKDDGKKNTEVRKRKEVRPQKNE